MSLEVRQFNCPNCGAPLDIKGAARSKSLVCSHCNSQLDLTQPPYQIIGNVGNRPEPISTPFTLGMQGTLDAETYQIIGRVRYRDLEDDEPDIWDEWLLLSSQGAYRWFSHTDDGEGIVLWRPFTPTTPVDPNMIDTGSRITLDNNTVRIQWRGVAVIEYLEGELTWRARVGDRMNYADGEVGETHYSIEWTENEIEFFKGQRRNLNKVEQAFGLPTSERRPRKAHPYRSFNYGGAGGDMQPTRKNIITAIVVIVIVLLICGAMFAEENEDGGFFIWPISSGSPGRDVGGFGK